MKQIETHGKKLNTLKVSKLLDNLVAVIRRKFTNIYAVTFKMPTTKTLSCLPFFAKGVVVKGFGRGSKELGIPTANYSSEVVDTLPNDMETGIYYGFANVDGGPVYKMVMSIGWNPFYKNVKKSMETHIMHNFASDFYGSMLKTCIVNYIRPEQSYDSLDALIDAIKSDIAYAENQLDLPELSEFQKHSFFSAEKNQDLTNSEFLGSNL